MVQVIEASECPHFPKFDPLDPEQVVNPFPILAEARKEKPVFYMPEYDLWVVTRFKDVQTIYRDLKTYSNAEMHEPRMPRTPEVVKRKGEDWHIPMDGLLNRLDGADHMRVKKVLFNELTRAINGIDAWLNDWLNELVDGFIDDREVDIIESFSWCISVSTIARLLDASETDAAKFREWSENWFELSGSDQLTHEHADICWQGFADFEEFAIRLIDARRADPGNDIVSKLIEAQEKGAQLSYRELVTNILGLVVAATDTTANSIGMMMYSLAVDQDLQKRLRNEEALRASFIEELLRARGPLRGVVRKIYEPVELSGISIPAGATLYVHISSASRDEETFTDPEIFDPERANARKHFAFGSGARMCIGAALARLEIRKALDVFLDRVPQFGLSDPSQGLTYSQNIIGPALHSVKVCW
ncbi:cytochrome P450 [Sphingosinicella xenopeptidilytica]|uniref:Cytochrome P450 n=1 Tax=Sphingosinicella xenopeptidilytica TaxID=364098 RepID=A0ABW3C5M6_SPHXN